MIRVEAGTHDLEPTIRECFGRDPELLAKWHIEAPASLDICVSRTMSDVEETFDLSSFQFYRIFDDQKLVAYFGTEFGAYINLIFVDPAYRTPSFMQNFWKIIKEHVKNPFFTAVYTKNAPAVSFYTKLGSKIKDAETPSGTVSIFTFENGPLTGEVRI